MVDLCWCAGAVDAGAGAGAGDVGDVCARVGVQVVLGRRGDNDGFLGKAEIHVRCRSLVGNRCHAKERRRLTLASYMMHF